MKTNEYRIGNYVSRDGNIMKVVVINERGLSLELVEKATGQQTNSGRTVPMLLTEEWLVRLGYTKCLFIGDNFEKNGHRVWKRNDIFLCDKNGIVIKHVHKLQNLHYTLKDKEITL